MNNVQLMVVFGLIGVLKLTLAVPRSELYRQVRHRMWRDASCGDDLYTHNDKCCVNCPAGTYVKTACTRSGESGTCEECDHGRTYTEHRNNLKQCLKCTQCPPDQEVAEPCTLTQDTKCQCKLEGFCTPEQPCEVCKKCSICGKDEVTVSECARTSNTVCKKHNSDNSAGVKVGSVVGIVLPLVFVCLCLLITWKWKLWKKCKAGQRSNAHEPSMVEMDRVDSQSVKGRQNGDSGEADPLREQLIRKGSLAVRDCTSSVSDEDKGLGDSLANSASNSQTSLYGQPPPLCPASLPLVHQPRCIVADDQLPKVAPLNGESSLKSCFEYFEEVDVNYHNRFFRHLGIQDNVLKSKSQAHLTPEDRVHELLGVWMEKMGREANLNDLLKALVTLNQKLTAQNIMDKSILNCHYVYDEELPLSAGEVGES